jgi:hypothetical protein
MNHPLICLVITVSLLVLAVIGLVATIEFVYLPIIQHRHSATCMPTTCVYTSDPCQEDAICTPTTVTYTLIWNQTHTNYSINLTELGYFGPSGHTLNVTCDDLMSDNLTCFFDDRQISATLSLNPLAKPIGVIYLMVFLGLIIAIMVMTVVSEMGEA